MCCEWCYDFSNVIYDAHASYRVTVMSQKCSYCKHYTGLSMENTAALLLRRIEGFQCWLALCLAVTPPLVNTGLEAFSEDKNTLASQQRGRNARILLSSSTILHREIKPPTFITRFPFSLFFIWGCCCDKYGSITNSVNVCIMYSICYLDFHSGELCFRYSQTLLPASVFCPSWAPLVHNLWHHQGFQTGRGLQLTLAQANEVYT